jgi:hypothetical protein
MKQFVALMGIVLLIGACGRGSRQRVDIQDMTKPITLTLAPLPGETRPINYLTVHIRGRINGHADLSFGESLTNRVGPRFTIKRTGNYTGTNCVIRYVPRHVTSGTVTIQYAFD